MARTTAKLSRLALFSALSATGWAQATFQSLGDLPGGAVLSDAYSISGDGTTVVGMSEGALGPEAFRWRAGTGMVGLGDLAGGAWASTATATSATGDAVVGYSDSASGPQAFRWTTGGMVGLGFMSGRPGFSIAEGVAVVGTTTIVVGRAGPDFLGEGFRWSSTSNTILGLGDLGGGDFFSQMFAVSSSGTYYCGESTSGAGTVAVRWNNFTYIDLGDLAGGETRSRALSVSSSGNVVVGFGSSANGQEAFRWVNGSGMTGLGDLPGGYFDSVANDVSDDGAVVVGAGHSTSGREAFVWSQASGMKPLVDVLRLQGLGSALNGWRLTECNSVSADGTAFAGVGFSPTGEKLAWLARAPQPTTISGAVQAVGVLPASFVVSLREPGQAAAFDTRSLAPGAFSFSGPRNLFQLTLKPSGFLRRTVTVDARAGAVSGVVLSLLAGDLDGDNDIDIDDYDVLAAAYGSFGASPADLDLDQDVDIDDYDVLATNYGAFGDD